MVNQIYIQGDVLIERVNEMPKGRAVEPINNRIVLASGEVTGHHHSITAADVDTAILDNNGAMFLRLCRETVLTHQEHNTIPLAAGTYRVTIQREYHPEEIRNVKD